MGEPPDGVGRPRGEVAQLCGVMVPTVWGPYFPDDFSPFKDSLDDQKSIFCITICIVRS